MLPYQGILKIWLIMPHLFFINLKNNNRKTQKNFNFPTKQGKIVGMEIILCEQKAFIIPDQITAQAALLKAREKKISAFDAMSKVGSFLSHPKDEDFELLYCEHRYEPFWHIKARSNYTYDRDVSYLVKTTGPEVKSVSYFSKKY